MKAVVAAFNQEKALVGALSVIVQLHRLIVYTALVLTPPTEDLRGVGVHEAEAGGQEAGAALHLALVTGRSVCGTEDTGDSDTSSGEILKFRVRLILS